MRHAPRDLGKILSTTEQKLTSWYQRTPAVTKNGAILRGFVYSALGELIFASQWLEEGNYQLVSRCLRNYLRLEREARERFSGLTLLRLQFR